MKRHLITSLRSLAGLLAVAAVLLCTAPERAAAQSAVRVGIVNFNEIISKLPEFKQVEGQLQGVQQRYMDTLRALQINLEEMVGSYQKQQALMNAETKAAEEQKIVTRRDELLRYQQERLGQNGAFEQIQAQLLQPIREKVRSAIERVAKSEKLTLVLEANSAVYFDEKTDITFKVLDFLKRGTN
jgi:outer membrane protein